MASQISLCRAQEGLTQAELPHPWGPHPGPSSAPGWMQPISSHGRVFLYLGRCRSTRLIVPENTYVKQTQISNHISECQIIEE